MIQRIKNFAARHRTGTVLAALLTFSLLLTGITTRSISIKPKEVVINIISPFQHLFSEIGSFFGGMFNSISELKKLREEIGELQKKVADYQWMERNAANLRAENKELNQQLGFKETIRVKNIPAKIIGKDPGNMFSTITINKGYIDGIRRNMAVVSFRNGFQSLVGKIIYVGLKSSIIMPVYDPDCFVTARLKSTRYQGLISGSGFSDEVLIMKYVRKRAADEIKIGDLIVTSGLKSLYPKDIYIGRVREKITRDYETYLELKVEPIIDFSRIEYVYILVQDKQQ
jgi:rod shape-determining protein MreC